MPIHGGFSRRYKKEQYIIDPSDFSHLVKGLDYLIGRRGNIYLDAGTALESYIVVYNSSKLRRIGVFCEVSENAYLCLSYMSSLKEKDFFIYLTSEDFRRIFKKINELGLEDREDRMVVYERPGKKYMFVLTSSDGEEEKIEVKNNESGPLSVNLDRAQLYPNILFQRTHFQWEAHSFVKKLALLTDKFSKGTVRFLISNGVLQLEMKEGGKKIRKLILARVFEEQDLSFTVRGEDLALVHDIFRGWKKDLRVELNYNMSRVCFYTVGESAFISLSIRNMDKD